MDSYESVQKFKGEKLPRTMDDGERPVVQTYALIDNSLNGYDYFCDHEARAVEAFATAAWEILDSPGVSPREQKRTIDVWGQQIQIPSTKVLRSLTKDLRYEYRRKEVTQLYPRRP